MNDGWIFGWVEEAIIEGAELKVMFSAFFHHESLKSRRSDASRGMKRWMTPGWMQNVAPSCHTIQRGCYTRPGAGGTVLSTSPWMNASRHLLGLYADYIYPTNRLCIERRRRYPTQSPVKRVAGQQNRWSAISTQARQRSETIYLKVIVYAI